jgi:hypothetical protein
MFRNGLKSAIEIAGDFATEKRAICGREIKAIVAIQYCDDPHL